MFSLLFDLLRIFGIHVGQGDQHFHTVLIRLAHSQDSPAANFKPRGAHLPQRVHSVLKAASCDDFIVEFLGAINVVVVEVKTCT